MTFKERKKTLLENLLESFPIECRICTHRDTDPFDERGCAGCSGFCNFDPDMEQGVATTEEIKKYIESVHKDD